MTGRQGTSRLDRRLSVAPMMDWTDRHDRYFLRLISRRTLLYTEMVTTGALIHGPRTRLLAFDPAEQPVALQVGGCDRRELAAVARMAEAAGYDEVNLNVGCPSDRVRNGRFGACLMAEPDVVAEGVAGMIEAADIPVTVKTRIGIDDIDSEAALSDFVGRVAEAGCRSFAIHARKAWLQGLSPKENRSVPPLDHDRVHRLKREFPDLEIVINGGIASLEEAKAHLREVDGVMIGRAAYQHPWLLAEADRAIFGDARTPPSREAVARAMCAYIEARMAEGVPLKSITRHMLGLFNGLPGARAWRRHLSEEAHKPGAGPHIVEAALERVLAHRDRMAA